MSVRLYGILEVKLKVFYLPGNTYVKFYVLLTYAIFNWLVFVR